MALLPVHSDHVLYQVEGFLLVLGLATYGLFLLLKRLRRDCPDLRIGGPIAIAFALRVAAAMAVSALPNARALRGPDELTFLANAQPIRASPLLSILTGHGLTPLQQWLFALQQRVFDASDLTLRLTQISLAVVGLALLAAAVYRLAGPGKARLAAWLIAFEPTNVFFSGFLHKEPLITFSMGVVAYGSALMWRRRSLGALALMSAGCLLATLTRPYAGWFLIGAAIAITLHASMRTQQGRRAALLAGAIVCLIVVAIPFALRAAPAQLQKLQASQIANTTAAANLKYEKVDYSTPGAIASNLPLRISEFLLRPYPWQLQNTSQQLGAIGGVVMLLALFAAGSSLFRSRGEIMTRAGPLVYIGASLLVAYAVTAGNAGTAFRVRENVTAVLICLGCLLYRRPVRIHVSQGASYRAYARPETWHSENQPVTGLESSRLVA